MNITYLMLWSVLEIIIEEKNDLEFINEKYYYLWKKFHISFIFFNRVWDFCESKLIYIEQRSHMIENCISVYILSTKDTRSL